MTPGTSRERRKTVARLDFEDPDRVTSLLSEIDLVADDGGFADDTRSALVSALADVGDPDQAALLLVRLAETGGNEDLVETLLSDDDFARRLFAVLGSSRALGEWLTAHGREWELLQHPPTSFSELLRGVALSVGADPDAPYTGDSGTPATVTGADAVRALRTAYRRGILDIASRDLTGQTEMERVADDLSDLAAALIQSALAVAAANLGDRAAGVRLAVIGMGKCGAHELNYVSDVDVIYVGEPTAGVSEDTAMRAGAAWASEMMRICKDVAWEVDAALRPEGKAGQLVRTMDGHRSYYERWARTWEFQALLKARPIAGDPELGQQYVEQIASRTWEAAERDGFVADVQAMRRRVEDNVPDKIAERELKLGPGGLRDIEFSVQILQMVHGRGDESIRAKDTLSALAELVDGGYIGRDDGAKLGDAYRFLRTVEHRLMLTHLRRTHLMPDSDAALRPIARSLGYKASESGDEADALVRRRKAQAREVRRLHEKVFYRPLLNAVAEVPGDALRLTTKAAADRLRALGFERPDGVLKHVEALIAGTSRTASMQRLLLPAILSMFADAPDPDGGMLAYRQVSEQLGSTPWYLRLLRDEGAVTNRLARVLGSSKYVAGLLGRAPEAIQLLAEASDLQPRPTHAIEMKMFAAAGRAKTPEDAIAAIRSIRRGELVRIACADILDRLDGFAVGQALTSVADATIRASLSVAGKQVAADADIGIGEYPVDLSVIAMGRYGGEELGYGSDADVMYVYDVREGHDPEYAAKIALRTVELMIKLLAKPGADPAVGLDADLRPEGRNGALVRSIDSFREYYERWSQPWERQALLRARPSAGDDVLGARFVQLIDPYRYPDGGLSPTELREIRRIKARVDSERLPRGADPTRHLKLGRGGLSDIEWTVQVLQLQHAYDHGGLRTTSTIKALRAAAEDGLIGREEASALETAWVLVSRCRDANMLAKGKASDELPRLPKEVIHVARLVGYPDDISSDRFLDDYAKTTRRAHNVAERLLFA
ncbi:bifunctional [glutamine synthetase] adenylyltransferase/[glutamine synthetase]-adenylyl-L-tyrosine phosphorylase [Epidermidibacterium keratini]|uniref:Bifunctional [glutamine synthetase] adenylyltransferase/[glutamine synthetase]-adenylyl-L-tyrosine phosphorylase n=1 Tax=Epidermidibacterium keratini TaxID=1891644 RepID=A0A7L4YKB5_9ACTN|nr:bifunctional [glutamine synthetase] adenylyltransferase/[glutamine synthetase]-adenylyl-L-tyrosine phosphorylase [Epidermidibacterium keratini]QHB99248.1 bifunctional [glutamine synthetase] adenylyltransferase/[glutamine synthetase]-adenylyl-L-tyrosine phosphorylase [Epidermidibacterium keratini]